MNSGTTVELERDCEAVQIPAGNKVTLPAGTAVYITQSLGGSLTVRALDGLFQIDRQDADALGMAAPAPPARASGGASAGSVEEKAVWDALRECYDPEIPVNIVDLGLVYDLGVEPLPAGGSKVFVKMTLTAPGCGMGPVIARNAQERLLGLPGVTEASVDVVWDPPWHQSMITPAGRLVLGLE